MEHKYKPMQSLGITEVQMGSHTFPFTFVCSREVSVFIEYTHLYFFYVTQFISESWFSEHLPTSNKFYLQTPNTRNLCFIIYQGVPMKSNNIIQLRSH